jgi:hypothetical protein
MVLKLMWMYIFRGRAMRTDKLRQRNARKCGIGACCPNVGIHAACAAACRPCKASDASVASFPSLPSPSPLRSSPSSPPSSAASAGESLSAARNELCGLLAVDSDIALAPDAIAVKFQSSLHARSERRGLVAVYGVVSSCSTLRGAAPAPTLQRTRVPWADLGLPRASYWTWSRAAIACGERSGAARPYGDQDDVPPASRRSTSSFGTRLIVRSNQRQHACY